LEKRRLKRIVDTMHKVEMAVVVSEENGEEQKFDTKGLDIRPHRKRMNELDAQGHDLEYRFKDPNDPLQLVFVCAMWLTGFDAPTVSTLYLDKPQKDHSLMQTIARANRVTSHRINGVEKSSGEVVDYYGVLGRLKKAVKDYGQGNADEPPIRDKEELFGLLDAATKEVHAEDERHIRLGLTEDELEIYDLLRKDKLSKADEKKVRLAAKALLKRLTEEAPKVLVQDWYKDSQTRMVVRDEVGAVLDQHLPRESYDRDVCIEKRDQVFDLTLDLAINEVRWAA
jgi:type I site-specific restriction-modification system R (restriction) subunit